MDFPETPNLSPKSWHPREAPIYLTDPSDAREAGRAIGISLLGVEPIGPATFFPEHLEFRPAWASWLGGLFEETLGPHFIEIFMAAGEMRNRQIARLDRRIDRVLCPEESERSLTAAVALFEGTTEVRRLPQWVKFLQGIDKGESPGHATSLFALRSALFHLPLLPALVSYVFFEWKSATVALAASPPEKTTASVFGVRFPESIATVKRVFESGAGDALQISSV